MQSSKGGAGGKPCLTPTCRLVRYTYKKISIFVVGISTPVRRRKERGILSTQVIRIAGYSKGSLTCIGNECDRKEGISKKTNITRNVTLILYRNLEREKSQGERGINTSVATLVFMPRKPLYFLTRITLHAVGVQ